MVNTKKLLVMAKKWQKAATLGRKRLSHGRLDSSKFSTASVAKRGHLFVYTIDGRRFMIPLSYLTSSIFRELFKMSEDEFGLPSDGPITLPCDASCMEYIVYLIQHQMSVDAERAVLNSVTNHGRCMATSLPPQEHNPQQPILYGF